MISVIICTYNRKELLARAIRSVLEQEGKVETEIVVADDGSKDGTADYIKATFPKETQTGRLRVYEYENSGDAGVGRNRGTVHAKGEYLAFLDDDDCWKPGRLLALEPFLGKKYFILEAQNAPQVTSDWLGLFLHCNYGLTSSALISKELFESIGGFPEGYYKTSWFKKLPGWEDYEVWLRALLYLERHNALSRFELMTERFVVYQPLPSGLGDTRIRKQMLREAMTLLRVSRKVPPRYWPLLSRRLLGATKAMLLG